MTTDGHPQDYAFAPADLIETLEAQSSARFNFKAHASVHWHFEVVTCVKFVEPDGTETKIKTTFDHANEIMDNFMAEFRT